MTLPVPAFARLGAACGQKAKGGRPTREEGLRRQRNIMEAATRLFLERGFAATSLEAVADEAGVSKATVYAHYTDKRSLFAEMLRGRINHWLGPLSRAAKSECGGECRAKPLPDKLDVVSRYVLAVLREPETVSLRRSLIATAPEFPELARLAETEGRHKVISAVAALLDHHVARGEIAVADTEMAADLFLAMVTGPYAGMPLLPADEEDEPAERRRSAAIELFLKAVDYKLAPAGSASDEVPAGPQADRTGHRP